MVSAWIDTMTRCHWPLSQPTYFIRNVCARCCHRLLSPVLVTLSIDAVAFLKRVDFLLTSLHFLSEVT